jgi:hypothetical protein
MQHTICAAESGQAELVFGLVSQRDKNYTNTNQEIKDNIYKTIKTASLKIKMIIN